MNGLHKLRFPIGEFQKPANITSEHMREAIDVIEKFPAALKREVIDLSDEQLDTQYRPNGWTIRQVVHHCADSHMNSLTRFKLALTEDTPTIRPYFEERWAELADTKNLEIAPSLGMLNGIHARWAVLLKSMSPEDLKRKWMHPEHGKEIALDENILSYSWHCNHHLAHITSLKERMGWE